MECRGLRVLDNHAAIFADWFWGSIGARTRRPLHRELASALMPGGLQERHRRQFQIALVPYAPLTRRSFSLVPKPATRPRTSPGKKIPRDLRAQRPNTTRSRLTMFAESRLAGIGAHHDRL